MSWHRPILSVGAFLVVMVLLATLIVAFTQPSSAERYYTDLCQPQSGNNYCVEVFYLGGLDNYNLKIQAWVDPKKVGVTPPDTEIATHTIGCCIKHSAYVGVPWETRVIRVFWQDRQYTIPLWRQPNLERFDIGIMRADH